MGEYIHLSLPKEIVRILEEKAKDNYVNRSDVARQCIMKSLADDAVVDLRKKQYSIRKIAETLGHVHQSSQRIVGPYRDRRPTLPGRVRARRNE